MAKKLTNVSTKSIGVPRTNKEKFDLLNKKSGRVSKNKTALELLRETFGLEVTL